ncbi:MAG: hypothetical protein M3198_14245 [Actinomycetota bacterium]|nr:hypothetical protein [Actinomycetota bacterium]
MMRAGRRGFARGPTARQQEEGFREEEAHAILIPSNLLCFAQMSWLSAAESWQPREYPQTRLHLDLIRVVEAIAGSLLSQEESQTKHSTDQAGKQGIATRPWT